MNRSERKIEQRIVSALKRVCDELTLSTPGFCWLTHFVDYTNVSQSLRVVCVFDTESTLTSARQKAVTASISSLVVAHLEKEGILSGSIERSVLFDTEEKGANVDRAKWCRQYLNQVVNPN